MLGRHSPRQYGFSLGLPTVPNTALRRLLHRIAQLIDFEPLRAQAAPFFSPIGRPSVDPVVMLKMMLVGYLCGIASDRELVDECADRWSVREFIGYAEDEPLPVHADFTHWRQRLGAEFFRTWLHQIVLQCQAHGMLISHARTVDATSVKAQADKQGTIIEVPDGAEIAEYVAAYFAGQVDRSDSQQQGTTPISAHDPEARLQTKSTAPAQFRYQVSFSADPESGLICDATAAALEHADTAVEHVDRDPLGVAELAADSLYDDGDVMAELQARGVTTYVPRKSRDKPGILSKSHFTYNRTADEYVCPEGKLLRHYHYNPGKRLHMYIARTTDCASCPRKAECTRSSRRTVTRTVNEAAREQAVRAGERYKHLLCRRNVNEHLNHLGKRDHGLSRARGLGRESMCIQAALTAIAIDIKKLVRHQLAAALAPITRRLEAAWGALRALYVSLTPCSGDGGRLALKTA